MALNGNFVSFQSIIESVYRKAGYQTIDWADAVETVAETIRLIGILPAYQNITTNGLSTNPVPLEVVNYRVVLPTDYVALTSMRKVNLEQVSNSTGGTDLKITSFAEMLEATDLFYKSIRDKWSETIPSGTYNYVEFLQTETITLTGTSGTASITVAGGLTKTLTFNTDLTTTASDFVTANAAAYLAQGIVLTSGVDSLIFTANVSGTPFSPPVITNVSGDLDGTVTSSTTENPVLVFGQEYRVNPEIQYEYKIDNGYIYTNFETGFIEMSYLGFVTDDSGFPMIPEDQRYQEAIKWSLIEHLDYKKWRVGEISDKVYAKSEQERAWYIASAKSKADTPTIDQMESMKNMFLRLIPKINEHGNYFKYSNAGERMYTQNHRLHSSYKRRL